MATISNEGRERLLREKYHGLQSPEFFADCARLEAGEPIEYVLGFAEFLGAKIDLSRRPMIPRFETGFWVERAINELRKKQGPLRIADTFSGSGNVGIALLKHLPNATVDLSELDAALLPGIHASLAANGIDTSRARIFAGRALEGLEGHYDAIFAVPPYVAPSALPDLDPEMIKFEPHLAFFADDDGRAFHRLLIAGARDFLANGGTLYMEADMDQDVGIKTMLEGTAWSAVEFWPDPYGATPNVVLRK